VHQLHEKRAIRAARGGFSSGIRQFFYGLGKIRKRRAVPQKCRKSAAASILIPSLEIHSAGARRRSLPALHGEDILGHH